MLAQLSGSYRRDELDTHHAGNAFRRLRYLMLRVTMKVRRQCIYIWPTASVAWAGQ
jgi:hypothetical protein